MKVKNTLVTHASSKWHDRKCLHLFCKCLGETKILQEYWMKLSPIIIFFFRRVVVVFVVVVVVVTPVYLRVSMSYSVYSFTSVKKMNAFTANA